MAHTRTLKSGEWEASWQNGKLVISEGETDADIVADVRGTGVKAHAKARLLAAAPDLVEILELLWTSMLKGHLNYDKDISGTIAQENMVKAALAKAKGG